MIELHKERPATSRPLGFGHSSFVIRISSFQRRSTQHSDLTKIARHAAL